VRVGFCCDLDYENTPCVQPCLGKITENTRQRMSQYQEIQQKLYGVSVCAIIFDNDSYIEFYENGDLDQNIPTIVCYIKNEFVERFKKKIASFQSHFHNNRFVIEQDGIPEMVEFLKDFAFEEQGYTESVARAREATYELMLCLRKRVPKDVLRLLGQYLYSTRYEIDTWN